MTTLSSDNLLKCLGVIRQLGYGFYLAFDSATLPDALGVRKWSRAKQVQEQAYRAWFIGLAANAIAGAYTLWLLRQRERNLNKKDGEGVVEGKKIQKYVPFISVLSWLSATLSSLCLEAAFM